MSRLWIIALIWCWTILISNAETTEDPDSPSTTLAYITRPPLVLFSPGFSNIANRSHPAFARRRIFTDSTTTSSFVTDVPTSSFTSSSTLQESSSTSTTTTTTASTPSSTSTVAIITSKATTIAEEPPITSTSASSSTSTSSTTTVTSTVPTIPTTTTIISEVPTTSATEELTTTTFAPRITAKIRQHHAPLLKEKGNGDNGERAESVEDFEFDAKPLPSSPTTSMQVSFRRSTKYDQYYLNCTDSDDGAATGGHSIKTFLLDTVPFIIPELLPGHLYVLHLFGSPVKRAKKRTNDSAATTLVNLARTDASTDPDTPRIVAQNISVTTKSIGFSAEKSIGSLQDYFILSYSESSGDSSSSSSASTGATWNVNVTDIADQPRVEFYVGGLNAGSVYNVSVAAFRRGKSSKKWNAIIVTSPEKPSNVRVISSDANEIVLAWDRPQRSGVDSYYVSYHGEFKENATEIDTRDLTLKLDNGIIPGELYYVDIHSVKGGNSFSEAVYLEISTKPLPPLAFSVNPNYATKLFDATAALASSTNSRQDSCILQYLSDDESEAGKSLDNANNVSAPAVNDYCRWSLPLTPGRTYRFRVWTARKTAISDAYTNSSNIKPAFDAELFGITPLPREKTLEIRWNNEALLEYWPTLVGQNANLSASLMNSYQLTRMVNPMTSTSGLVFDPLISGACYSIQVYATAFGIVSRNRTRYRLRLDPSDVTVSFANATSTAAMLNVRTESPPWIVDPSCRVVITVKDDANHTVLNKTMITGQSQTTSGATISSDWTSYIFVTNLRAFSKYEVFGVHVCGNDGDECESKRRTVNAMKFETGQGVPGSVRNVRIDVRTPSIAQVQWDPPDQTNGMLTNFLITVVPDSFSGEDPWNISLPANALSFQIQNLTGGFKYSFDVRAQTTAGISPPSVSGTPSKELPIAKMLVWAPPKPFGRPEILYNTVRETDFSLRFNLSMFSTRNGLLEGYTVIVVEGDAYREDLNANQSVGTWFDVQSANAWPPYAALNKPLPRIKNLDSSSITEVIGVDMDCAKLAAKKNEGNSRQDSATASTTSTTQFCNGPLRPGKKYRVKLRVHTSNQLFSDSDYSDVVITSAETGTSAGTVIAIILAVIVVLAIGAGILLFLRGRGVDPLSACVKAKSRLLTPRLDSIDGISSGVTQTISVTVSASNGNGVVGGGGPARRQRSLRERTGVDGRLDKLNSHHNAHHHYLQLPTVLATTNMEISRPVLKSDFAEHVRLMSADSDFRFSEEYEEMKQVGRNEACTAADIPCNRNKNRFTNILPYDHSRVKLVPVDDEEGSDYINASYIPGHHSPREYIAAQGPLPSTRDDFWRMIWEQNCPAVLNLTRCIEKGREKCDQYWPGETDPVYYGDIEVLLMNETRFPEWTVREFKVENAGQTRTVRHFHFTGWPDFGVPERPQTLVKFVRALRTRVPPAEATGPIVVHCSAGVGRSGTLIAIDRIMHQLDTEDYVDIYGLVYEMRKERAWMVQTEQQYICIFQCILCVLEGRENEDNVSLYAPRPQAPPVEIHQNPAFEDDEGIAESGV